MAAGDVTQHAFSRSLELLTAVTAVNGVPTAATHGQALNELKRGSRLPSTGDLMVRSTAGSGTMTAQFRLWAYHSKPAVWMPIGTGTASGKGLINAGVIQDEVGADVLRHLESVPLSHGIERLYLELTSIGGTATAVSAWLIVDLEG